MRMLKTGSKLASLALALLIVALAVNTWRKPSRQLKVAAAPPIAIDTSAVVRRLSGALRFRTISRQEQADASAPAFDALHGYLQQQFPRLHSKLDREVIGGHSLLYRWQGIDPGAAPILLIAHQDVVPVSPGTERQWTYPPFSGAVRDGYVWGRGAWDDKGNLLSMLEAVELLLASGFQPRQTVYLAFGHDEENFGERGAKAIAETLRQRGVRLQFVLDEGMFVVDGLFPGLKAPLAMVGTAEKGYATLKLSVSTPPGHSSAPGPNGVIARLSRALTKLDDAPFPAVIDGVTAEMLDTMAPEMTLPGRVVLSNRWVFGPAITAQLAKAPSTAALLRTTTALTVARAGDKENVLPGEASALVNFRLMPGDSVQNVVSHVTAAINDEGVTVSVPKRPHRLPEPASTTASGYRLIETTIRQTYPEVVVAPALVVGGTDSRHFTAIAEQIYRFTPVRAEPDDLARYHGTNERIAIANYTEMIRFYARLIANASADAPRQRRGSIREVAGVERVPHAGASPAAKQGLAST